MINTLRVAFYQSIDNLQEHILHQCIITPEDAPLHDCVAQVPFLTKLQDDEDQALSAVHFLQDGIVNRRDVGMGGDIAVDGNFADLSTLPARATSALNHTLDGVLGALFAVRVDTAVDCGKGAGAESFDEEVSVTDQSIDKVGGGVGSLGIRLRSHSDERVEVVRCCGNARERSTQEIFDWFGGVT